MKSAKYLENTPLLDFESEPIERLVNQRGWQSLPSGYDRIGAAYQFVRDEIRFGYNRSDDIPASEVLADGYGQCNTKATLLMALLRAVGQPCRLVGATIHKDLQRGAVSGIWYWLAPAEIIHTWVEVELEGRWIGLEGVILDRAYIDGVRCLLPVKEGPYQGYALATRDLANPDIEWQGDSTHIQSEGIARKYGTFDSPDEFYKTHGVNLSPLRRFIYSSIVRHRLNSKVASIRLCSRKTGH